MNYSQFKISIGESSTFLNKFKLFKSIGPKGNGIYSEEFICLSRSNNIIESYKCAVRNFDYDIMLQDDSIIQFQFKSEELRYAFIQNPYNFYTREEYLNSIYGIDELSVLSEADITEMIISINEEDYEQFLNEQKLNSTSNYFRYDFSKAGYRPLVHSYSHLHIGLNPDVRIPSSKILTPLKFTKFIIKNTYYNLWKSKFDEDENFIKEIEIIKKGCADLTSENWTPIEKNDLYLS